MLRCICQDDVIFIGITKDTGIIKYRTCKNDSFLYNESITKKMKKSMKGVHL